MKKLFLILITLSNYLIAQQTGTLINPAAINGYTTNGKVLMTKTSGSITGVPSWTNTIPYSMLTGTPTIPSTVGLLPNTTSLTINGVTQSFTSTPTFTIAPTLQEVIDNNPHLNGTIYSLDNNTSISVSDLNLGLNTDGFLNLDGNIVRINGVQAATVNDLPTITSGTNITVSGTTPNYTVSVDAALTGSVSTNTSNITSLQSSKQNTLVAGTNITLSTNTISATTPTLTVVNGTLYGSYPTQTLTIPTNSTTIVAGANVTTTLSGTTYTIAATNDLPYITPENYGALGNGTTNDNTAIQKAINAASQEKKAILFSNKTYSVTGLVISDSITMIGMGYKTILATSSNTPIISITGSYNNIRNIHFKGNSTGSIQNGISAVGNSSLTAYRIFNYVNNCYGENLGGSLIYSQYMVGTNSGNGHQGAFYVSDCEASNCTNGFFFDTRAEYNTIVNCQTYSCTAGFNIVGGNNTITGGKAVQCTYGAYLSSGTNDSHGAFIGTLLNHNTNNIYTTGIANGMLFNDCNIYSGNIQILTSESVMFNNCALGGTFTITTTNSTNTLFNDCRFYQTPTFTITGTAPLCKNCDFIGSQPTNIFNDGGKTVDYSTNSTITGWSSFTVKQLNYAINGKVATVWFQIEGASNSTTTSVTLPFKNVLSSKFRSCYGMSNSVALTNGAVAFVNTNGTTINWYTDATVSTGLSASGTKKVIGCIEFQLSN